MQTEQEMRESEAPTFHTTKGLMSYIEALVEREHDHGTSAYAMSLAATAAFNHVASRLGANDTQARRADMDFLRRTRSIEGPFAIIQAEDMLWPQRNIRAAVEQHLGEWSSWAKKQAQKLLAENPDPSYVSREVLHHWQHLAADGPEDEPENGPAPGITARVESSNDRHTTIRVFQDGGSAGLLTVETEVVREVIRRLTTPLRKRCEACDAELTACGEMGVDGERLLDCVVCQMRRLIRELAAL